MLPVRPVVELPWDDWSGGPPEAWELAPWLAKLAAGTAFRETVAQHATVALAPTLEQTAQLAVLSLGALHGAVHPTCVGRVRAARSHAAWHRIFTDTAMEQIYEHHPPRAVADRLATGGYALGCVQIYTDRIGKVLEQEAAGAAVDRYLASGSHKELARLAGIAGWSVHEGTTGLAVAEWWKEQGARGNSAWAAAFAEIPSAVVLAPDLGPIAGRIASAAGGGARMLIGPGPQGRIRSRAIDEIRRESRVGGAVAENDPCPCDGPDKTLPRRKDLREFVAETAAQRDRELDASGYALDLTSEERRVLELRLEGLSGTEIAKTMGTSPATVSRVERVLRAKLTS